MVLIEARACGGTFATGEDALAMGVPLLIADYSTKLESNNGNRIRFVYVPFSALSIMRRRLIASYLHAAGGGAEGGYFLDQAVD
jgi:hypothetical protein